MGYLLILPSSAFTDHHDMDVTPVFPIASLHYLLYAYSEGFLLIGSIEQVKFYAYSPVVHHPANTNHLRY